MRIAVVAIALVLAGCARNLRSTDPANWLELRSDHFTQRTDLPQIDAGSVIAQLELQRAALVAAGWQGTGQSSESTFVVALASACEVNEFARKEVEGFAGHDAFGQPLIVIGAGDGHIIKHELAHLLNSAFLTTQPRWLQEGLAAYMETLRLDGESGEVVRGEARPERIEFLEHHPIRYFDDVIGASDDFRQLSASETFAFQSASWLLVHWMVDTWPEAFRCFLARLSRGENVWLALSAEFPGLHEPQLQAGLREYLKARTGIAVSRFPKPSWTGRVEVRAVPRAEVYATRAELFRYAPPGASLAGREEKVRTELMRALAEDPGNPLALRLRGDVDPTPAIRAHPEDWRAWVLYYDKHHEPWAIEQAARLAPGNPGVVYRLAVASQNDGDGPQALSQAERALEVGGTRPEVLEAVAGIYAANGRCEEARTLEQRAMNALPSSISSEMPAELHAHMVDLYDRCEERQSARRPERSQVIPLLQSRIWPLGAAVPDLLVVRIAQPN